jgi:5-formyltetrahydrofolate cyclo-ligase
MFKKELRKKYLNKRFEINELEIEIKSKAIFTILISCFDFSNKTISLFMPIKSKHEVNTFYLLNYFLGQSVKISIPKSIFETNEIIHYEFKDLNQLELNEYNIPEPTYGNIINVENFDIVFVPLLTIDRYGNRVGYGKGFYDRFLNKCKKDCLFIGLYLFDEIEDIDDLNEFDLPLHFCVTPNQLLKF